MLICLWGLYARSNDRDRIQDAEQQLFEALSEEQLMGIPVLGEGSGPFWSWQLLCALTAFTLYYTCCVIKSPCGISPLLSPSHFVVTSEVVS